MSIQDSEQRFLALFMAFYQRVEGQISAYAFWALITFIRNFGVGSTSLPLGELSKVIGIQVKKLRGVLNELEQQGILKIDFPETGKRSRVRHLQLNLTYIRLDSATSIEWLENSNKRVVRQIPLLKLIQTLFIKSDGISISNSPKKIEIDCYLDYRSYLVLLRLLYGADSFGIVIGCGIGEIERATGLSKQSIYRAIQQLKKNGFIRCQADGAIRNSFIQTESPIYALNLSHRFWGGAAIYGKFYILKYPQPHVFEVQKVASIFTMLNPKSDLLSNTKSEDSGVGLKVLNCKNYYLLHDPLCWMKPFILRSRDAVGYANYVLLQQQEIMKLYDHYVELKRLHPENPLSATFYLKPHENILKDEAVLGHLASIQHTKLSGMNNRLGLFQSLLEQWCCQIYSQNKSLFKMLKEANPVVIDDESFERLGCTDFLYPYSLQATQIKTIKEDMTLKNESDKIESMITFKLNAEQSRIHQFLMALMDLIAYNQIYFFQQCMRKHSDIDQKLSATKSSLERVLVNATEIVTPFRILPRSFPDADDILIRQVVPEGEVEDHLLNAEHHFSTFKAKFGKTYATKEEHDHRFGVFKSNMRRARLHAQLDPSAVHGVTKFSDLTPAEFHRQFLGLKPLRLPAHAQKAPILPTNNLPKDFDWRDKGAVTNVKDQGSCGSCWSFSTTGALEGAHFLATGELVSLSEQQLVDCDHVCDPEEYGSCDSGCNGGLMNNAFEYLIGSGGVQREKDYPYTGRDGTCKFDKSKIAASVSNYSVISLDEEQIAANLVKNGPLAVAINAVYMQTYVGGVSCPYICGKHLDHGVLLVGYGEGAYAPIRFKEKPYWIIKNSWGENWGENGYYKICRGRNVCGVDSMVSTVGAIHASTQ